MSFFVLSILPVFFFRNDDFECFPFIHESVFD
jgi:hypothetical protein